MLGEESASTRHGHFRLERRQARLGQRQNNERENRGLQQDPRGPIRPPPFPNGPRDGNNQEPQDPGAGESHTATSPRAWFRRGRVRSNAQSPGRLGPVRRRPITVRRPRAWRGQTESIRQPGKSTPPAPARAKAEHRRDSRSPKAAARPAMRPREGSTRRQRPGANPALAVCPKKESAPAPSPASPRRNAAGRRARPTGGWGFRLTRPRSTPPARRRLRPRPGPAPAWRLAMTGKRRGPASSPYSRKAAA